MNEDKIKRAEHMAFEHASALVRHYRTLAERRLIAMYALAGMCVLEAVVLFSGLKL